MLKSSQRTKKKKFFFRRKDDTFFHFLQLGLSMKEALAGGRPFQTCGGGAGKPQGATEALQPLLGCGEDPQVPSKGPSLLPLPLAGQKAGKSEGWGRRAINQDPSFSSLRDHTRGPLPLTSFEIRNDTQLSKIYLHLGKKVNDNQIPPLCARNQLHQFSHHLSDPLICPTVGC